MLKAFINIKLKTRSKTRSKTGSIKETINTMLQMPSVSKIFTMTGEYDLLVEFDGNNTEELHDFHFHLDAIETIEGVITNVVMKEFEPL